MKVTAIQMEISDNKDVNRERILSLATQHAESDVICFPELCLQADEHNIMPVKDDVALISQAAAACGVAIIFGAYVKVRGNIRNRLFVVSKSGRLVHMYDKRHPYVEERSFVQPGTKNKSFVLNGIRCALINCWDYAHPEDLRALAREGAIVIFCPAYLMSFPYTKHVLEKIPQVRAFDSMAYFVMVDAYADDSFGRSKICHPLQELAAIEGREGAICATIDKKEILLLRQKWKNL